MREPSRETVLTRPLGWLDMYMYPSRFMYKYHSVNNWKDWNYLFYRDGVKDKDQDVYIIIQTSQHCYTVTHYRVLDGFNEVRKFHRLFDAAQYFIASAEEYERLYAEQKEEDQRIAAAKRAAREAKKQNQKKENKQ